MQAIVKLELHVFRSIAFASLALFVCSGAMLDAASTKRSGKSRAISSSKKRRIAKRTSSRRYGQTAPTPQRYMEIQQALADRGYYKGPVNGQWGADSADALKRFQQDQNLSGTGKLDAMSLIALGLGPKRSLTAQAGSSADVSRSSDDHRRTEGSERP
jgi:peptidoglycan hydrolase-like protein with peptidoglycan-binding domain